MPAWSFHIFAVYFFSSLFALRDVNKSEIRSQWVQIYFIPMSDTPLVLYISNGIVKNKVSNIDILISL